MITYSIGESNSELAIALFGLLSQTGTEYEGLDRGCLPVPCSDEKKLRDEIRYLKAFAIHYASCVILGASREGVELRTEFMRLWDRAASTSAADRQSYNEFFERIERYGRLAGADTSAPRALAIERISEEFAKLLDPGSDPSTLSRWASCASTHFTGTCNAVAQTLKLTAEGRTLQGMAL